MDPTAFLGRGLKFPLQVDPRTGSLALSGHEEDIGEAIGIILRTYPGERVMLPEFGCSTADYAFEGSAYVSSFALARELQDRLVILEPRITDVSVTAEGPDARTGRLVLNVEYTVRTTNNRFNRVYPFYLEEGEEGGVYT